MSNFSALKTAIQNAIKQNGNQEITGNVLQNVLISIIETLGDSAIIDLENTVTEITNNIDNGYVYAGIATPSTTPVSGKVFYIALQAGTYTNFGNTAITQGINFLKYNGSVWSKDVVIGIDDVPMPGSTKLPKSGGTAEKLYVIPKNIGYITPEGNVDPTYDTWRNSDMFPVISGDIMTIFSRTGNSGTTLVVAFYDANKQFLKDVSPISTEVDWSQKSVTVPAGAYFARINTAYNSRLDSGLIPYAFITKSTQELASRAYDAARINSKTLNGDAVDFVNDGFIKSDGSIDVTDAWKYTDMIAIPKKSSYKIHNIYGVPNIVGNIVFYDCDEKIMSVIMAQVDGLTTLTGTAPDGAAFARLCTKTTHVDYASFVFSFSNQFDTMMDAFSKAKSVYGRGDLFTNIGYIDKDAVVDSGASSWRYTDYIIVPTGAKYVVKNINGVPNTVGSIVFYDINKIVVGNGIVQTDVLGLTTLEGTVPDNAFYARMTTKLVDVDKISFEFRWDNPFETILTAINLPTGETLQFGNNFMGKPFSFNGKTAVFFGDSVTEGVKSNPLEQAQKPYVQWLTERLGMTYTNYAVSGTCICDPTNNANSILNKVLNNITAQSDYDFIFIAGGVNDFATGKPVGSISDDDYTTFYGSLNVMCEHLNTVLAGKNTQVIFLTPLNFSRTEEHWVSVIASLNAYRNAIFKVATMKGYNVVDMSVLPFPMGIQAGVDAIAYQQAVIYDGIHPTEYGHKMMGLNIASLLL